MADETMDGPSSKKRRWESGEEHAAEATALAVANAAVDDGETPATVNEDNNSEGGGGREQADSETDGVGGNIVDGDSPKEPEPPPVLVPTIAGDVYVQLKLLLPRFSAGALIGRGGERIVELQKKTGGTKIKVSRPTDCYPGTMERVCTVSGPFEGIMGVIEAILMAIKQFPDPQARPDGHGLRLVVPDTVTGSIIGKGGEKIRQIEEAYSLRVSFSKEQFSRQGERVITITGKTESSVKKAARILIGRIHDALNTGDDDEGALPGRPAAALVVPVADSDDRLELRLAPNPQRTQTDPELLDQLASNLPPCLTANGFTEEAAASAAAALRTLIDLGVMELTQPQRVSAEDLRPAPSSSAVKPSSAAVVDGNGGETNSSNLKALDISVHDHIVGAVIGPRGSTISRIEKESGARVRVSKKGSFMPGSRNRIISVTGTPSSVDMATVMIHTEIENEKMRTSGRGMRQ